MEIEVGNIYRRITNGEIFTCVSIYDDYCLLTNSQIGFICSLENVMSHFELVDFDIGL